MPVRVLVIMVLHVGGIVQPVGRYDVFDHSLDLKRGEGKELRREVVLKTFV